MQYIKNINFALVFYFLKTIKLLFKNHKHIFMKLYHKPCTSITCDFEFQIVIKNAEANFRNNDNR